MPVSEANAHPVKLMRDSRVSIAKAYATSASDGLMVRPLRASRTRPRYFEVTAPIDAEDENDGERIARRVGSATESRGGAGEAARDELLAQGDDARVVAVHVGGLELAHHGALGRRPELLEGETGRARESRGDARGGLGRHRDRRDGARLARRLAHRARTDVVPGAPPRHRRSNGGDWSGLGDAGAGLRRAAGAARAGASG